MVLKDKLKEARIKADLTQKQVAKLMDTKDTTISNWETGVSRPDVDTLGELCKLYKASPNSILEWGTIKDDYYINDETALLAQEIYDNSTLRILFDAAKGASPDSVKLIAEMVKRTREDEGTD